MATIRDHARQIADYAPSVRSAYGNEQTAKRNAWCEGYWHALVAEGYTEREADAIMDAGYDLERVRHPDASGERVAPGDLRPSAGGAIARTRSD